MHCKREKTQLKENQNLVNSFKMSEPTQLTQPGIVIPLAFFASIGSLCLFIFCCVRTLFKDIYLPRLCIYPHPSLSKGFFSWIYTIIYTKEEDIIPEIGLDSVTFLKFLWMGSKMFTLFSVFGLFLLPTFENSTGILYEDVLLEALSVNNVPNGSSFLWIHLVFTWIFSLLSLGYLVSFYKSTIASKVDYERYLLRQSQLRQLDLRSIMVFGIPLELRTEVDLASYFEYLGIGNVENVVICRKWTKLRHAVQMRAHYLCKLEQVYSHSVRSGVSLSSQSEGSISDSFMDSLSMLENQDSKTEKIILELLNLATFKYRPHHRTGFLGIFGPKVDSLAYYLEHFREWNQQVEQLRRIPEKSSATSVGFVTFVSPESAAIASQTLIHKRPFAIMSRMAPEPRDIYWPNLSSEGAYSYYKFFRSVTVMASLLFLVFSSTAIVTTFAGLIDLRQLALYLPVLREILAKMPPAWIQLIQGVIPTILVAAWTSSLPFVLLILCRMQGLETVILAN